MGRLRNGLLIGIGVVGLSIATVGIMARQSFVPVPVSCSIWHVDRIGTTDDGRPELQAHMKVEESVSTNERGELRVPVMPYFLACFAQDGVQTDTLPRG